MSWLSPLSSFLLPFPSPGLICFTAIAFMRIFTSWMANHPMKHKFSCSKRSHTAQTSPGKDRHNWRKCTYRTRNHHGDVSANWCKCSRAGSPLSMSLSLSLWRAGVIHVPFSPVESILFCPQMNILSLKHTIFSA